MKNHAVNKRSGLNEASPYSDTAQRYAVYLFGCRRHRSPFNDLYTLNEPVYECSTSLQYCQQLVWPGVFFVY